MAKNLSDNVNQLLTTLTARAQRVLRKRFGAELPSDREVETQSDPSLLMIPPQGNDGGSGGGGGGAPLAATSDSHRPPKSENT